MSRESWSTFFVYFCSKLNVANSLLVFFTFILASSTVLLWLATRDLVKDAEDTAERRLRAYVYIGSFNMDLQNNLDGSSTFTVNPSLKVFSITPAAWVSPSWDLKILPAWSPGQFPALPITAGRADLVAAPGQDYRIGAKNVTLQKIDIKSLKNRTTMIVAFGRITYNDVFGKPRWTDFCTSFDWHDANTNNAELCPEHNDSDWSGHRPPPLVISTPLNIVVSPAPQKPP
jgi:hypothetical protein